MIKASNLQGHYKGLTDGETYQLRYEHGENCIAENTVKNLEKYIGKKAKAFRNNKLVKIDVSKIVVGDRIVIEKGDIVPAEGKIIEANNLALKPLKGVEMVEGREYHQVVYQGMKVIRGYAVIEITAVGDKTYLGNIIKDVAKVPNSKSYYHKKINRVIKGSVILTALIFVSLFIVFCMKNTGYSAIDRILYSLYPAFSMILAIYPIELIILYIMNIRHIKNEAKKKSIYIKNIFSLGDLDKIKIICVSSKMLTDKNAPEIQKLYREGKRIIIFDRGNDNSILKIAKAAKLITDDVKIVSGEDVLKVSDTDVIHIAVNEILFNNMNAISERRIVESLKKAKLSVLYVGEDIDDSVSIRMADIGVSESTSPDNFESDIADVFVRNVHLEFVTDLMLYREKNRNNISKILNKAISIRILAIIFMAFMIFGMKLYLLPTLLILFVCPLLNVILINISNSEKDAQKTSRTKRILKSCAIGLVSAGIMCGAYLLIKLINDYTIINIATGILFVILNIIICIGNIKSFKMPKAKKGSKVVKEKTVKKEAVTKEVTAKKEHEEKPKKIKEVKEKPKKEVKKKLTKQERMEQLKQNKI